MEKEFFKFVYHSHTKRCGHAFGEDEEFVLAAINRGIKKLCFTDHTPIPFLSQKGIRMDFEEIDEYVSSIKKLKEKYKDQIEIHISLECENFPSNNQYLRDLILKHGVEYIIIGQHVTLSDNAQIWVGDKSVASDYRLKVYTDAIIDALDSGLSKYVAHPDLIISGIGTYNEDIENQMRKIVEAAIRNDAYLEFNIHGIINCNLVEFGYPNKYFWQMVKKDYPEAKITIGLDIHSLKEYESDMWLSRGIEVINEIGLHIIDEIDIEKELICKNI